MSRTIATSNGEGAIKVSIPRRLQMALLKIQVDNDMDWNQACEKTFQLLDGNSEAFKQAVQREALRIYKSRHMAELNKAKETFQKDAMELVRKAEDNFRVPCNKCHKPMYISSRDDNWETKMKPILYKAFGNWIHTNCE